MNQLDGLGNKEIFAKNLKRKLEEKGMTQTDLCEALGFKSMTVSDWINAKSYPRIDKIEKMATFFRVPKSCLIEAAPAAIDAEAADMARITRMYRAMPADVRQAWITYGDFLLTQSQGGTTP